MEYSDYLDHIFYSILDTSIKAVIIIVVFSIVGLLIKNKSADFLHDIWLNILYAILFMPILTYYIAPDIVTPIIYPLINYSPLDSTYNYASTIYLAGILILLLNNILGIIFLQRHFIKSRKILAYHVDDIVKNIRINLGIRRKITVIQANPEDQIFQPMVWGVFRKVVFLPHNAGFWPEDQLTAIILHELTHLSRKDLLTKCFINFIYLLHWFNPLILYAQYRLYLYQELACDNNVLNRGVKPSNYLNYLYNILTEIKHAKINPIAGLYFAKAHGLKYRIANIQNHCHEYRNSSLLKRFTCTLLIVCITIPLSAIQLYNPSRFYIALHDSFTLNSDNNLSDSTLSNNSNYEKSVKSFTET